MITSDFHGDGDSAKRIAEEAFKENVDLILLAGDLLGFDEPNKKVLEPFEAFKEKVFFVPGNWDFSEDIPSCEFSANNLDRKYCVCGDIGIVGLGSPNWKLTLNYEDFLNAKENFLKLKTEKKILLSHLHVKESLAEFSGIPGDYFLKKIVEEFQPDIVISGHVHEAEGLESKIGKTRIFHTGRSGRIIIL